MSDLAHVDSACDSCYLDSIGVTNDPCELQIRSWVEYVTDPALTPFTRQPITHAVARAWGIASWARANRRAREARA